VQVWQVGWVWFVVVVVVGWGVMLGLLGVVFWEDYDVGFVSDVFFGAAYFGAVAYGCDFGFEESGYVVDCQACLLGWFLFSRHT